MSSMTEKKYVSLRKRLDQLGYRQALGIESLPLVERLFGDLLHTTDSLKKAKLCPSKSSSSSPTNSSQLVEDAIESYRVDNARLVKENNHLHLNLVKTKESLEASMKTLQTSVRKLEHENADLRFLNTQYIHKIKVVERESSVKTETIQKLQEKNLQAVIQTPGGRKRSIPFRRQRMQIDATLPPSESSSYVSSQPDDPYIADLVQVADTKINQLSTEVKNLEELKEINSNKIKNFKQQVEDRDREIARLNISLEGGRPHDVVSLEAKHRSSERLLSHLHLQIDYLQQTNQELEDRIKELEDGRETVLADKKKLEREVDRLHSEIRDIDVLTQELEQERKDENVAADCEIQKAQLKLRDSQRHEECAETRLQDAQAETNRVSAENRSLQEEVDAVRLDVHRLNGLLDKVESDKRLLTERVQAMSAKEKNLVMELEHYRANPSRARMRDKSPSRIDSFVRTLEQERDHYREECDVLQSMLREHKGRSRSSSPRSRSPGRSTPSKKTIRSGESHMQLLRERDELQIMLNKFERHMTDVQTNVKVLTQERDKTNMLYEQTNEEIQRLRRECIRSPKSPKASMTAQAILRRVENDRDSSISDLRRMTTERDTLREKLHIQQEQRAEDRLELDKRSEQMESEAIALQQERQDLQSRLDALKNINFSQEEDIKTLRLQIQQAEEDYESLRNELDDTKAVKSQIEKSLENNQRILSRKSTDLAMAEDRVRTLENRVTGLMDDSSKRTEEAATLRATTTALDREKDTVQAALDERAERVACLEAQLERTDAEVSDLRLAIADVEAKLDRAGDDLASSEREVRSLRRQLDSTQSDLAESTRAKEAVAHENRRLQEDLSTLTRENQDLNIELDDALRDRDSLKKQVEEKSTRISILDGTVTSKDRELQDLLDQYRKLSSDRDSAESRYRVVNDESQTLRAEILACDSERKRCCDRIEDLEREISNYIHVQQTYETQVSNLTSSVVHLEEDLERMQNDSLVLKNDLQSVRDLNTKLDSCKEQLGRQVAAKNVELEQLRSSYEDLILELETARRYLDTERVGSKDLEDIVAGAREKEFQAQLDLQEQKSEGQILRDRLALNENKLQSMMREMASLRDRTSKMDAEMELAKQQLTNEQYERERAIQELKRHGLASPGLPQLSRPLSPASGLRSNSPPHLSFSGNRR